MTASNQSVATRPDDLAGLSYSFEHMQRIAKSMAESKLFGAKNADQCLSLMLLSQAEVGTRYSRRAITTSSKATRRLKADTLLARYIESGGKVKWTSYTDAKVSAEFTHPNTGTVAVDWDMERAKRAGLATKDNWKSYPRAMMRARVISEGVKTSNPAVAVGIYTTEEIQDLETVAVAAAVEAVAVSGTVHALAPDEIEEHMNAMADAASLEARQTAFGSAWTHAAKNKDGASQVKFKAAYDDLKKNFEPKPEGAPL